MVVLSTATRASLPFAGSRGARLLALLLLASAMGCAGPRHMVPATDPSKLSDDGFVHYLTEVPVVTVDEGFRAMLILADGEDGCKTFEQRRDKLTQRGIARREWNLEPQNVIDRGAIAAMTCKICRIRGGVNRVVFGSVGLGDRRYATRELVYQQLMNEGPDYAPIQGGELVGLLTKADAYMESNRVYDSKSIELGSEAEARKTTAKAAKPN